MCKALWIFSKLYCYVGNIKLNTLGTGSLIYFNVNNCISYFYPFGYNLGIIYISFLRWLFVNSPLSFILLRKKRGSIMVKLQSPYIISTTTLQLIYFITILTTIVHENFRMIELNLLSKFSSCWLEINETDEILLSSHLMVLIFCRVLICNDISQKRISVHKSLKRIFLNLSNSAGDVSRIIVCIELHVNVPGNCTKL